MPDKKNKYYSMRDVAQAAGVSIAAVSRTLNGKRTEVSTETMARVMATCEHLGYQLNPSIQDLVRKGRTGMTRALGVAIVGRDWAWSPYADLLEGMGEVINEQGYNLFLAHLSGKEKTTYEFPAVLRDGRCDGFLLTGHLDSRIVNLFNSLGKPLVILGYYDQATTGRQTTVRPNIRKLAYDLVETLKKEGKSKISHFVQNPENYPSACFFNACRQAMRDFQLDYSEELVFRRTGCSIEKTNDLRRFLLKPDLLFDSIICQDYRCALEVAYLLGVRYGKYDCDDILIATLKPSNLDRLPVRSIYYGGSSRATARTGVSLLIEMLAGKIKKPVTIELPASITIEPAGMWYLIE